MGQALARTVFLDQRSFVRVPLRVAVWCLWGPDERSLAQVVDVGRGGMAVRLTRLVKPGDPVLIQFSEGAFGETGLECKGRVAWCHPAGEPGAYVAGVRVIHDEPAVLQGVSALVNRAVFALAESGGASTWEYCRSLGPELKGDTTGAPCTVARQHT